jgi:hypothetical protein
MQKRRTKAKTAKLFNSSRRRSLQRQIQRKVRMRRFQFHLTERLPGSEPED